MNTMTKKSKVEKTCLGRDKRDLLHHHKNIQLYRQGSKHRTDTETHSFSTMERNPNKLMGRAAPCVSIT
uniref:Uncharacterized protein n=1 Tax=Anguilla anguilla TaxID=7936 RepID=A0A0E9THJ9_ANGAN